MPRGWFLNMGEPLNSQWLVLRIDGTDFLHCWVANSVWLEHAELVIALMVAYLEFTNFKAVLHVNNSLIRYVWPASSWACDSLS